MRRPILLPLLLTLAAAGCGNSDVPSFGPTTSTPTTTPARRCLQQSRRRGTQSSPLRTPSTMTASRRFSIARPSRIPLVRGAIRWATGAGSRRKERFRSGRLPAGDPRCALREARGYVCLAQRVREKPVQLDRGRQAVAHEFLIPSRRSANSSVPVTTWAGAWGSAGTARGSSLSPVTDQRPRSSP